MALLFCDGFDNYATPLSQLWDQSGTDTAIDLTGTKSRTGIGALQIISSAFGPEKFFAHFTHLLACLSWNSDRAGECMRFDNTNNSGGGPCMRIQVNADGSISFYNDNAGPLLGSTAANVVTFNTYNSIAVEINGFDLLGTLTCWVNGVQVFQATGQTGQAAFPYCNGFRIMGPGGSPVCYIDDFYLLNCSVSPNTTFLGALKLYPLPPTENASPLQWTPNAGTNWSNVNEVPPDGDTSYNQSSTVGQVDQYLYPATGIPANASILFVAHELDMKVDSGSRSVASDLNGTIATGVAITSDYHIYQTQYDVNPDGGGGWTGADFPVKAGPAVTA